MPESELVTGNINWQRRYDHMQQHTGQHVLSSVFSKQLNTNTIGFHIGAKTSTIDLDLSSITYKEICQVENATNQVVWNNCAVVIHYISEDKAENTSLRKQSDKRGEIRVIWIVGIDTSACGGTHLETTGEIGLVKITGSQRNKGNIRISYVCGNRALKDYQRIQKNISKVSNDLSIHSDDLQQTISRIQSEAAISRGELKKTRNELMSIISDQLWDKAEWVKGVNKITAFLQGRTYEDVMTVVKKLRFHSKSVILIATNEKDKLRLICSRSEDLEAIDCTQLITLALNNLGGKGGGTPEIAQGGAPLADKHRVEDALNKAFEEVDKIND
jgi:alanyl-tRNA synthetase